jgi:hypothetical protein
VERQSRFPLLIVIEPLLNFNCIARFAIALALQLDHRMRAYVMLENAIDSRT